MFYLAIAIGKLTYLFSRLLKRGHGSALPGLIVEKIYPGFLRRVLSQLPDGVVLISGTNGKTTTTKIVVDLLRSQGREVFTNSSGSNFVRGVISAALPGLRRGRLAADIAVLELDEAHAVHFVDQVRPRYSLLLNVLRDQLDRFGEIDKTAKLLNYVAERTTGVVVINNDDPRLINLMENKKIKANIKRFGASGPASLLYRTDEEIHNNQAVEIQPSNCEVLSLDQLDGLTATYKINNKPYTVKLRLFGIHNALNCAAALALVQQIDQDFSINQIVAALGSIRPAFGRGEIITVAGDIDVRLILVKNPSGFQLSLDSGAKLPSLIAINDEHADGRDVSWLWDVSFADLKNNPNIATTGVRADDMAVRLTYSGVNVDWSEASLSLAIGRFVRYLKANKTDGQIFATYTAMLKIRDILESMEDKNG